MYVCAILYYNNRNQKQTQIWLKSCPVALLFLQMNQSICFAYALCVNLHNFETFYYWLFYIQFKIRIWYTSGNMFVYTSDAIEPQLKHQNALNIKISWACFWCFCFSQKWIQVVCAHIRFKIMFLINTKWCIVLKCNIY